MKNSLALASPSFTLSQLWRYPVKGLGGQRIDGVTLDAGAHFPGDRTYAIGSGHENVADGTWLKKAYFLQLMSHEVLADLDVSFPQNKHDDGDGDGAGDGDETGDETGDENGDFIELSRHGTSLLRANMQSPEGRRDIAALFDALLADDQHAGRLRGPCKMVTLDDGAFTDTKAPLITLGGSASFDGFAKATGTTPDARRFRLNMIFETDTPFEEFALIGKTVAIGDVRLEIIAPVGRCAAIDVDPQTAMRGPHYLPIMAQRLGHTDLGIFASIVQGGRIAEGDQITLLAD